MGLIKTLKKFLSDEPIYPVTKTNAVYDDKLGRLDQALQNTLVMGEEFDEEEQAELRDADTLEGQLPEFYAKQSDVSELITSVDELSAKIPQIDDTLTASGSAADAKAVGDAIYALSENLTFKIVTQTLTNISATANAITQINFDAPPNGYSLLSREFMWSGSGYESVMMYGWTYTEGANILRVKTSSTTTLRLNARFVYVKNSQVEQ